MLSRLQETHIKVVCRDDQMTKEDKKELINKIKQGDVNYD
jgi:hypothetical protein